jgi:hypothetical protein
MMEYSGLLLPVFNGQYFLFFNVWGVILQNITLTSIVSNIKQGLPSFETNCVHGIFHIME